LDQNESTYITRSSRHPITRVFLTGFVRLVFSFSLKFGIKKRLDYAPPNQAARSERWLLFVVIGTYVPYYMEVCMLPQEIPLWNQIAKTTTGNAH
jgi:hypothetical protein